MDKTLTPSPWTTQMDYPSKILFQMSGTLRSCDYIFTLHRPSFSFGSASLSAAILSNYSSKWNKFDVTVIVNLIPMWCSSSVFLEQSKWSSGCYAWFVLLLCAQKQLVVWFFSWVDQNEVEMGTSIKLWDSKKFQRLRYNLMNAKRKEKYGPYSVIIWSQPLNIPLIWNSIFLGVVHFRVVH